MHDVHDFVSDCNCGGGGDHGRGRGDYGSANGSHLVNGGVNGCVMQNAWVAKPSGDPPNQIGQANSCAPGRPNDGQPETLSGAPGTPSGAWAKQSEIDRSL